MLNALRQNRYKEVIWTNYIGNGCFNEAGRDGCRGAIVQTGLVLFMSISNPEINYYSGKSAREWMVITKHDRHL